MSYICIHVYLYMYFNVYIYIIDICSLTHRRWRGTIGSFPGCIHLYLYIYIHTQMYTHTHTHTHTHTRTHITYTHLHTHREMEGYESELFLSYFAKGGVCPGDIEILQGGNASGFRCVCVCMCVRESVCIAWEGHTYIHSYIHICTHTSRYRVATMRRLLKITGLFCKRALEKRLYSAKQTYNFKEPTNRSHPISGL